MSKFLSRAAVLTLFLLALFSCRNETFFSEAQNSKREEEFFKNALQKTAKFHQGNKIVNLLETLNVNNHFINKMHDKKGLPVWDQLQMFKYIDGANKNTDSVTITIVPMSPDNLTLSSLLFVKSENQITEVNNISNEQLQDIVNNENISKQYREGLLTTFFYIDQKLYNSTTFINIPADLFPNLKYGTNSQRIKMHNLEADSVVYSSPTGKIMYVEVCTSGVWRCKNNDPYYLCDHCNLCYTTVCSMTPIYTNGDSPPEPPGNQPPVGGGSNGGNTPPPPPTDPCTPQQGPFYRPMPGCGDGGEPIEDPCSTAKPAIDKANTILKDTNVKTNMTDVLKNKVSAPNEWGVAISKNNNVYSVTPPKEGSTTQGSIPQPLPGDYVANGHSHSTGYFGSPSGGDFYSILELISGNTKFETMFIYGTSSSGSVETYALVISDKSLATEFLSQYPKSQTIDPISHAFLEQSPVGLEYNVAYGYATLGIIDNNTYTEYDPKALAMAYILENLNTGISLSKIDNSGDLKKLNVSIEKIKDTASGNQLKTGLKVTKCP